VNTTKEIFKMLSLGDLRQILAIKETQDEIEKLLEQRDELLRAAEAIQVRIDHIILSRCRGDSGRKVSYGKRTGPTVREMCEQVMAGETEAVSAAEVRRRVLERWPDKDSPTLYNQVFIALGRSSRFKKVKKGKFQLRDGDAKVLVDSFKKKEAVRAADGENPSIGTA